MNSKQFDAAQEAIQHYKKEGYKLSFTKKSIEEEDPANWTIEAVHSFTDIKDRSRNQIVYALHSKTEDKKGVIVRRMGTMAMPFKAIFLQQVELANDKAAPPQ